MMEMWGFGLLVIIILVLDISGELNPFLKKKTKNGSFSRGLISSIFFLLYVQKT